TDQEKSGARQERGVMAKVVSLNNDQLTVILADMPSDMPKGGEGGTPPDKGTPPAMNTSPGSYSLPPGNTAPGGSETLKDGGGAAPVSGPAVDDSNPPAGDQRPGKPGQGDGKIDFTGENVTYTLSGDVTITKGMGGNATEIDLSELAADDVISFTTVTDKGRNEVIDSIQILYEHRIDS
ncbi:MAG: hypothetical protein PHE79_03985, partial [Eubacteriales bacterium]|nr:hypothetical protein [Eubacteriales bacterium]